MKERNVLKSRNKFGMVAGMTADTWRSTPSLLPLVGSAKPGTRKRNAGLTTVASVQRFNEVVPKKTQLTQYYDRIQSQCHPTTLGKQSISIGIENNTLTAPGCVSSRGELNRESHHFEDLWRIRQKPEGMRITQPENFPLRCFVDFLKERKKEAEQIEVQRTIKIPRPCYEHKEEEEQELEMKKNDIKLLKDYESSIKGKRREEIKQEVEWKREAVLFGLSKDVITPKEPDQRTLISPRKELLSVTTFEPYIFSIVDGIQRDDKISILQEQHNKQKLASQSTKFLRIDSDLQNFPATSVVTVTLQN